MTGLNIADQARKLVNDHQLDSVELVKTTDCEKITVLVERIAAYDMEDEDEE